MKTFQKLFRLLRTLDDPLVDHSMAKALETADRLGMRLLVLSLLERRSKFGMPAILRHFDLLDQGIRKTLFDHAADLEDSIRPACDTSDPAALINVADYMVRSGSHRQACLLAGMLHHADAKVVRTAAAAILDLARLLAASPPTVATPRKTAALAHAIAQGAASYHLHGRRDVLLAAACLAPHRHRQVIERLTDTRHDALPALRDLIRKVDDREIGRSLVYFLGIEPLRAQAIEGLNTAAAGRNLPALIEASHLTLAPEIHVAIRKLHDPLHLVPAASGVDALSPATQRLLPRWINALNFDTHQRAANLSAAVSAADPFARLAAMQSLMTLDDESAREAIATLTFDAEPALARIALRHLVNLKWPKLGAWLIRLLESPHPDLRRMAERELSNLGFAHLWNQWETLSPGMRQTAGAALIKIDRQFHRQLAERMHSDHPGERLRAVMIARQLKQETYFEPQLLKLIKDGDEKVVSAAAAAMGNIPDSPRAVEALRGSLAHPDDRVRSNAVESLAALDKLEGASELLHQIAQGRGHRSRAAAIKALLALPMSQALPALSAMLVDSDARHRISALWLVEEMGMIDSARRVAAMASGDADPQVRRRAVRVIRRLADTLKQAG